MSIKDIAEFEAQLQKLCEFWKAKMTHAELAGVLDTVKMGYHIRTIRKMEETELCETPVIRCEQATAPPIPSGSPLPAEVEK